MFRFFKILLFSFIVLVGCDELGIEPDDLLKSRPLTAEEEILLSSSNEFSFDLLKLLNAQSPEENLFFSSIGIGNGLGMAFHIINDKSKNEIKNFLNISEVNDIAIDRAYFQLSEVLNRIDPDILYVSANSYWINRENPIDEMAENRIMAYYEADVELLNFQNPKSVKRINNWAQNQTYGRVKNVVDKLSDSDKSYMINLLHFDMNQSLPFKKIYPDDFVFTASDGNSKIIKTANQYSGTIGYSKFDDYSLIDIPLGKGYFHMTLIVPNESRKLPSIINNLSFPEFVKNLEMVQKSKRHIILPDIDLEREVRLKKLFPSMGITDPIKVISYQHLSKNLFVSDFLHKSSFTFGKQIIDKKEDTGFVKKELEKTPGLDKITIDKSFLFLIREKSLNAIIFTGKLQFPENN